MLPKFLLFPIYSYLVHLCIFQYVNYMKVITAIAYHNSRERINYCGNTIN